MSAHLPLDPSPFWLPGGSAGVLLIHGYTGAPPEMRLVGDYLHQRGFTVSAPLLPGHGLTPADMNRSHWTDWAAHTEAALAALRAQCRTLFVAGLSMGALLAIHLAATQPDLAGAVLYSPGLIARSRLIHLTPLAKHFLQTRPKDPSDLVDAAAEQQLWCYDVDPVAAAHELYKLQRHARKLLPDLRCPLLVIHSAGDRMIHPTSAATTYQLAGSTDKQIVTLHQSGHCLTVDCQWQEAAERSFAFMRERVRERI